ncbi:MAG: hypothetical protein HQ559_16770 [Lentisphaerae bacterium]|nr:hypothetical protein [Lentisphaerota bacterium]
MKRRIGLVLLLTASISFMAGCEKDGPPYNPTIVPGEYSATINNPFFPLTPGTTMILEGDTEDGKVRIEIFVTSDTRLVMGVTCRVVREREWEDGELVEDTLDWYAQHQNGDVWYFGEDSKEYEDGEVVSSAGSWEAGVDGALPGILMKGDPQVGDKYRQEYYDGEAEDMAEVIGLDASVSVAFGGFENCLQTREWTPLERGVAEHKFYARGVGLLKEQQVEGGEDEVELIQITP